MTLERSAALEPVSSAEVAAVLSLARRAGPSGPWPGGTDAAAMLAQGAPDTRHPKSDPVAQRSGKNSAACCSLLKPGE